MLSAETKRRIIDEILKFPNLLGRYSAESGLIEFLGKIWDLKAIGSDDPRQGDASGEIIQHMISNDDWTFEYLFVDKLKVIDGEEKYFISLIELVVSPIVRQSKEEILNFVVKINYHLKNTGFKLIITDYFEESPIYKLKESEGLEDLPIDISQNNIPIYLGSELMKIDEFPCVMLAYDNWDDYGSVTTVSLSYQESRISQAIYLGNVKIMKKNVNKTWDTFPKKFTFLSSDYCSLGQSKNYYVNLKNILGVKFNGFLLSIRDAAIFPKIYDLFENDIIFKNSLLRENTVERIARTIRFELEGTDPKEYFKFNYTSKPPYSENSISLPFNFEYDTDFEHRIYALIGKNGTGKTSLLSSLAKSLSEKNPVSITPRKPIYGKVFTVSYSFFDKFDIPLSDAAFNYVYCGLKKPDGNWKTEEELLSNFYESVIKIKLRKLETDWHNILQNFIIKDLLDIMFEPDIYLPELVFNETKFNNIRGTLSSGQSIILYIVSEILSQIRYDSLILYDEPETHLHPNAISALMNTLFDLLKRFQSFCIIGTHSPLIIQEIPARDIYVIERDNKSARVRGIERESFGENLTVISQEIFGNRETPRHYVALLEKLINNQKSYEEIIKILESGDLPITSNIRLYIKALIPEK